MNRINWNSMKGIVLSIATLTLVACGSSGVGGCTDCKTFVTTGVTQGNLGGVAGADAFCMTDANKPAGEGTYKALLVANTGLASTSRQACSTANCSGGSSENINWVLKPNTTYYLSDGTTTIMTTNASGINVFLADGGQDLLTSLGTTGGLTSSYFSGFSNVGAWLTDTVTGSPTQCDNWNSNASNLTKGGGLNQTSSFSLATSGALICNGNFKLVCVEQ